MVDNNIESSIKGDIIGQNLVYTQLTGQQSQNIISVSLNENIIHQVVKDKREQERAICSRRNISGRPPIATSSRPQKQAERSKPSLG